MQFQKSQTKTGSWGASTVSTPSVINLHLTQLSLDTQAMKTDPYSQETDPPFPTSMLPPRMEAIVKAIAAAHRVPDVMPASIALAILSVAMGKGLRIASATGRTGCEVALRYPVRKTLTRQRVEFSGDALDVRLHERIAAGFNGFVDRV